MKRCSRDAEGRWAIGIAEARSPLDIDILGSAAPNPVMTCARIEDVLAVSVAQPFLFKNASHFGMLFALKNGESRQWEIWRAWSADGLMWRPAGRVLAEGYSVSFPLYFQHKKPYYMLPDTAEAEQLRLYTADAPEGPWSLAKVLMQDVALRNPSPIFWQGRWYIIGGDPTDLNASLVYHADDLLGPWRPHPINTLEARFKDRQMLKGWPAGRFFPLGYKLFRVIQSNWPAPQSGIRVVEVKKLSATEYEEAEVARRAPFADHAKRNTEFVVSLPDTPL